MAPSNLRLRLWLLVHGHPRWDAMVAPVDTPQVTLEGRSPRFVVWFDIRRGTLPDDVWDQIHKRWSDLSAYDYVGFFTIDTLSGNNVIPV